MCHIKSRFACTPRIWSSSSRNNNQSRDLRDFQECKIESNTNEHIFVRRLRNDFEFVMFFRTRWGVGVLQCRLRPIKYFYKLHLKYLPCGFKPEKIKCAICVCFTLQYLTCSTHDWTSAHSQIHTSHLFSRQQHQPLYIASQEIEALRKPPNMHWGKRLIDKSVILCVLQHYYCVLKENYVKHIMFPLFAHTLPIMCKWD